MTVYSPAALAVGQKTQFADLVCPRPRPASPSNRREWRSRASIGTYWAPDCVFGSIDLFHAGGLVAGLIELAGALQRGLDRRGGGAAGLRGFGGGGLA